MGKKKMNYLFGDITPQTGTAKAHSRFHTNCKDTAALYSQFYKKKKTENKISG